MRRLLLSWVLLLLPACADPPETGGAAASIGECCTVTIRATVPEGVGTVYLTGNQPVLGPWAPDRFPMSGAGQERTAEIQVPDGTELEYKFTLGSWFREALSPEGGVMANLQLRVDGDTEARHTIVAFKEDPVVYMDDWQGSGVQGSLVYWKDVPSAFLERTRHVSIWLPPGYEDNPGMRYPVLYMHDGHALFDPRFGGGGQGDIWDVDDAIVKLVDEGVIPPVMVVAAWNSADRIAEYSPWHRAPDYARFLIEEIMPRVNREFRTLTGPENTAVMGSSMGGLLSYYLVTYHPDAFGACGCISSAFPLSEAMAARWSPQPGAGGTPDRTPYIIRDIENGLEAPKGVRYWFDYGTAGGDAGYAAPHAAVREWLLEQGFEEGVDFVVREYPGADHSEASWRDRLADPLTFLFGTGTGGNRPEAPNLPLPQTRSKK